MNAQRRPFRVLPVLGAFLCGLVLVFGAIIHISGRSPSAIGPAIAAVGGPFHLEDQNGKPVSDEDMKGRPFLVFFGFAHCPDVCPTTLFEMSEVIRQLGKDADRIGALFITVDPERDTPAALKDYLVELRSASARADRRPGGSQRRDQGLSGLRQENSARRRRLHDGPYRRRLSHGQGRPFRRAVQSEAHPRGGGRGITPLSLKAVQ